MTLVIDSMSQPAGYASFVRSISQYNVPGLTGRQKDILDSISRQLIQKYEGLDKVFFNQFEKLFGIVWTVNKADIPCENAAGCATEHKVYSFFYDNPRFESFIMSMELAHHAVLEYCRDNNITGPNGESAWTLCNDLVHYAANSMEGRYVNWITSSVRIQSLWDALKGIFLSPEERLKRSTVKIELFVYNMKNILDDTVKIMNEIRAGTAPQGANAYWAGVEDSPAKREVLAWLEKYESGPHHHHEHD